MIDINSIEYAYNTWFNYIWFPVLWIALTGIGISIIACFRAIRNKSGNNNLYIWRWVLIVTSVALAVFAVCFTQYHEPTLCLVQGIDWKLANDNTYFQILQYDNRYKLEISKSDIDARYEYLLDLLEKGDIKEQNVEAKYRSYMDGQTFIDNTGKKTVIPSPEIANELIGTVDPTIYEKLELISVFEGVLLNFNVCDAVSCVDTWVKIHPIGDLNIKRNYSDKARKAPDYNNIFALTTDGKQRLLESGYMNDDELEARISEYSELTKNYWKYILILSLALSISVILAYVSFLIAKKIYPITNTQWDNLISIFTPLLIALIVLFIYHILGCSYNYRWSGGIVVTNNRPLIALYSGIILILGWIPALWPMIRYFRKPFETSKLATVSYITMNIICCIGITLYTLIFGILTIHSYIINEPHTDESEIVPPLCLISACLLLINPLIIWLKYYKRNNTNSKPTGCLTMAMLPVAF